MCSRPCLPDTKRTKWGKTDFGHPPVNSWLWCEVKHFPQSFSWGQSINHNPQFRSDDQQKTRGDPKHEFHNFLLLQDVFYSRPTYFLSDFFTKNSSIFNNYAIRPPCQIHLRSSCSVCMWNHSSDCAVECAVDPAHRTRLDTKGGTDMMAPPNDFLLLPVAA